MSELFIGIMLGFVVTIVSSAIIDAILDRMSALKCPICGHFGNDFPYVTYESQVKGAKHD